MSIAFNPFDTTEFLTAGSDIVDQGYIKVTHISKIPPDHFINFISNGKYAMSTNRKTKKRIRLKWNN